MRDTHKALFEKIYSVASQRKMSADERIALKEWRVDQLLRNLQYDNNANRTLSPLFRAQARKEFAQGILESIRRAIGIAEKDKAPETPNKENSKKIKTKNF